MSVFALVDCNNFYVSCERVFQPNLENKPVAVLSNNDGCLVARSNEVKKLGIPMGAPFFKYKEQLKLMGCKVFSSNYTLYGDMSGRVMEILSQHCQEMEIYSIDEAFLDLTGIPEQELIPFCQKLKNLIKKCTGIPVSFGLASTKTLAKLANNLAKDDMRKGQKLYNDVFSFVGMDEAALHKTFSQVAVGDLWGIGRQYTKKLEASGINTVAQLVKQNPEWINKNLTIQGSRLVQELKGSICHKLELFSPDKKSIASTRSFGKSVSDLLNLKEAVGTHATRIGQKLRSGKQVTSFMQVFVMTDRFKENFSYKSANFKFANPTNYTPELIERAIHEVEKLFEKGVNYKKAGIIVSDLQSEIDLQQPLFNEKKFTTEKEKKLMEVFDALNKKFGKMTIRSGQIGYSKDWQMKQDLSSPRYTTNWKELLVI